MYLVKLKIADQTQERELGTWRDHAAERFAGIVRKVQMYHHPEPLRLEFIDRFDGKDTVLSVYPKED